ncbi:type VI secretion system lysozyme-like protein [Caballeronia arationis]|jgi:type VI secretion system protein ImpF|uniref:Type VI secretion system lysozyme-like protein n=1 Tax=Caballeronia arationis TaxID=1777142 RepID=A0A7Z7I449_9BURK|nr:type VI secretion system baseplate subunit TssE [Caballeronia arationis]SAK87050.1 type VI secretion system lysozyme-like protein [Caballeronia arationis]SOE57473.1 type VI secretion system lysozyme-like protein [Caballeronia arationis]
MNEPRAVERLQPSLLDRLIDHDPATRADPPGERFMTHRGLRAAVLRDLSWLFNTTNLGDAIAEERYPHAFASVLNYGLPCLSGRFASTIDAVLLEQAIRHAIERFEPRIDPATLEIEPVLDRSVLDMHNQIALVIRGMLWAQPVPLEFALRTQIDLEEGGITVMELAR